MEDQKDEETPPEIPAVVETHPDVAKVNDSYVRLVLFYNADILIEVRYYPNTEGHLLKEVDFQ